MFKIEKKKKKEELQIRAALRIINWGKVITNWDRDYKTVQNNTKLNALNVIDKTFNMFYRKDVTCSF